MFIILPSPVNCVDILSNGEVENLSPLRGEKNFNANEVEHQKFKRGFIILPSPVNCVDILSNGEVENLSTQQGEKNFNANEVEH